MEKYEKPCMEVIDVQDEVVTKEPLINESLGLDASFDASWS